MNEIKGIDINYTNTKLQNTIFTTETTLNLNVLTA